MPVGLGAGDRHLRGVGCNFDGLAAHPRRGAFAPARHPQPESPAASAGHYTDRHLSDDRVVGADLQVNVPIGHGRVHCTGDELLDRQFVTAHGGHIRGQGSESAGDVRRAAGDREPRSALALARTGRGLVGLRGAPLGALPERINVEEGIALGGGARGDHVEQAPLDHVDIGFFPGLQQQTVRHLDRGHAGAGLAVGDIRRQLEVLPEGFVHVPRSHAAGDVCAVSQGWSNWARIAPISHRRPPPRQPSLHAERRVEQRQVFNVR